MSNEWVSVETRLPELNEEGFSEHVLVSIYGGSMFVAWRDNQSADGWNCDQDLPELPTHWRPLPEKPKDGYIPPKYPRIKSEIDGNDMLEIKVGDYIYRHTVRFLEKDKQEWLMGVLDQQMKDIHERAVRDTKKEFQGKLRELTGLMKY